MCVANREPLDICVWKTESLYISVCGNREHIYVYGVHAGLPQGLHYAPQGLHYAPQGLHYSPQGRHYAPQGPHYAPRGLHDAPPPPPQDRTLSKIAFGAFSALQELCPCGFARKGEPPEYSSWKTESLHVDVCGKQRAYR